MTRRVLVVGDNALAGLQTVRSLGRAGLEIHLVGFESDSVTRYSRYIRKHYDLGQPLTDTERFLRGCLGLIEQHGFDLVIPTSDKSLVPLMRIRDEICQHTRFAGPDEVGFVTTQRKDKTLELAGRLGILIPKTQVLHDTDGMKGLADWTDFPLVLKPSSSIQLGKAKQNGVKIVRSTDEFRQRLPEMLDDGPVLVQEFCPGYGLGLNVIANRGTVVSAFQYSRVHEPPEGGPSTYRRSEPISNDLLENARQFCQEIEWTGPAMFEYKVHSGTGDAVLMEVNGRLWGSIALAIQAGVDFPRLLYELLVLNRVTEVFTYKVPFFVRNTCRDVYWLQKNLRTPRGHSHLIRVPPMQVLREFSNMFMFREGFDIESISDPVPGIIGWWRLTCQIAGDVQCKLVNLWYNKVARQLVRRVRRGDGRTIQRFRDAQSVLFVCTGNINRSAVAHRRMELLCGAARRVNVASAGLIRKEGRSTSDISREVAQELNLDLSGHRSSILTHEMLDNADVIVVMEGSHLRDVARTNVAALKKTFVLSAFDPLEGGVDIHDPYGGDRETFRDAYDRVVRCVDELAKALCGEAVLVQCESTNYVATEINNGHCVTSNSSST